MEKTPPKATLRQHIGLWSYKVFCFVLRLCDIRLIALFGRFLGYIVWMASGSRRRIVARNFRIIIDPALRSDKLNSLVRRNIVRTTMNLACSLKTGLMTDREMKRAIRIEGAEVFERAGMGDHTAICCVPHAGNWEILGRIRPCFNSVEHYGCMYRRLTNPLLEKMVYASRTAYGCEMFSKEDGLRAVMKLARSGGLLGVLSDQYTQEGVYLPYFGKMTGVTPLPALLYKRCKGKGTLFSVFTRNTGLGQWDAVLDRTLSLPEGCDTLPQITMQVNTAIENCQKENIIDGFWMHHRWKASYIIQPEMDEDTINVAKAHTRLPYRILICMPESFDEALCVLPSLRALGKCRFDVQLTVICPTEQQAYWQQQPEVTYTVTTDGAQGVFEQLDADEIYKDGPFDFLFMFSENRKVWKQLKRLLPLYVSCFAENPLATNRKIFRTRFACTANEPGSRRADYLSLMMRHHKLRISDEQMQKYLSAGQGNAEAQGDFIAPFSTLGAADSWPEENWQKLVQALPNGATLLALEKDAPRAEAMASALGIPHLCVKPEEVATKLGANTRLFAVDGLLPHLAAACGADCRVIMASRLAERYKPLGKAKCFTNHTPCHPCYRDNCDAAAPCTQGVSVEELLA